MIYLPHYRLKPPPLQLYPRIASRRRNIADPPTIVMGVEEHSDALSATREAIWEKRRQKDSSYRPPQLVPPPISQLYLNTARYFDPLHDEHGEANEGWRCDDIESGDETIDDFGCEVPARILDTRDPAMVASQESLRAETEAESESGRTSSQPPRNSMGLAKL